MPEIGWGHSDSPDLSRYLASPDFVDLVAGALAQLPFSYQDELARGMDSSPPSPPRLVHVSGRRAPNMVGVRRPRALRPLLFGDQDDLTDRVAEVIEATQQLSLQSSNSVPDIKYVGLRHSPRTLERKRRNKELDAEVAAWTRERKRQNREAIMEERLQNELDAASRAYIDDEEYGIHHREGEMPLWEIAELRHAMPDSYARPILEGKKKRFREYWHSRKGG